MVNFYLTISWLQKDNGYPFSDFISRPFSGDELPVVNLEGRDP